MHKYKQGELAEAMKKLAAEASGTAAEKGYRLLGFQVVESERVVACLYVSERQQRVSEFGQSALFGE